MNKKHITIIIVCYNSRDLILDCIDSIYQYNDIAIDTIEIVVVDNSDIIEGEKMKNLLFENYKNKVVYIKNENLGYGHGNNVGIKFASAKIIAIMNPDVRLNNSIFKDVLKKFENSKLGILGYKQLGGFNYSFYLKPEVNIPFSTIVVKLLNKIDVFFSKWLYLSGAFFFVDKEKFQSTGLFDENIFMYYEEPDIARRMQNKGFEITYDNSKSYLHLVGDRVEWSQTAFNREFESLLYYLKKYNIDKKKYFKYVFIDFQLKLWIVKLKNDTVRMNKIKKEINIIKNRLK